MRVVLTSDIRSVSPKYLLTYFISLISNFVGVDLKYEIPHLLKFLVVNEDKRKWLLKA